MRERENFKKPKQKKSRRGRGIEAIEIQKSYRCYIELCIKIDPTIRWTLPFEKLLLIKFTYIILLVPC
jgi:hypothetical protein